MKLSCVILVGLLALVASSTIPQQHEPKIVKDKQFLQRQKQVIQLVYHLNQLSRVPEHIEIANNYNIEEHANDYTTKDVVKDFLQNYKNDMLRRKEIFSVFESTHLRQAIALFKMFYYAKDYETFYKTAVWARQHMNEGMFLYSFSIAILHRADTENLMLPPIYELYPYYFFPSEVIHQAQYYKQAQDENKMEKDKDYKGYTIYSNYSGHYLNLHPEQSMSYYLEDVDMNAMYYYKQLEYPSWMKNGEYGMKMRNRGERSFMRLQQLLARYTLERLANSMSEVDLLDFNTPVETPYTPSLVYPNGLEFPSRPQFADLRQYFYTYGQKYTMNTYSYSYSIIKDYDTRINKAIDSGFVMNKEGHAEKMEGKEGMNTLGNLLEGNADSIHPKYYGKLGTFMRHLLGYSKIALNQHQLAPSALEHLETTLRDPIYYQMLMSGMVYYQRYLQYVPPYTQEQLEFPGVQITDVQVDKLVTYMDEFTSSLTSAVFYGSDDVKDFHVRVRQPRLNHKPFNYKLRVNSDKDQKVVVKAFLGPKYDEYGRCVNLTDGRTYFVELDYFDYDVSAGENVIERNSHQFARYAPDRMPISKMYRQIQDALEDKEEFRVDERQNYGLWPQRMMLPRGSESGTTYQMIFFVYPYTPVEDETVPEGKMKVETKSYGYPLDRWINFDVLYEDLPNARFYEAKIYYQDVYGLNYHY